ncbi:MAG: phospholipase D family protein [Betaproteobacteria bacterium]|nr:phospholipase D family protein [Betaproteobacteria bacterium]
MNIFLKQSIKAAVFLLLIISGMAGAAHWERAAGRAVQDANDRTATVRHNGIIEYAFSPDKGAEKLVLKVIDSAQSEIRMMAYSITSASVVEALTAARHRGIDVAIVFDHKSNLVHDQSGKARAALSTLVNAGCQVRTVSAYPIHHDKVIIVDRETVETGSFNFSKAATKNSENVLVVWKNTELARGYLEHWRSRFSRGKDYRTQY